MIMTLFDDDQILEAYTEDVKKDEARKTAEIMIRDGKLSIKEIARYVPALSMKELKQLEAEVMQL